MTSKEIIQQLKLLSNPKNIEGMKRFAVGGAKTLGVSIPVLRKIAKEIHHKCTHSTSSGQANYTNNTNKDVIAKTTSSRLKQSNLDRHALVGLAMTEKHQLALELWDSGYHEARILASMIDEPSLVTEKQMDDWIADFDSWDVCDQVCMNLFAKLAERSPSEAPEGRRGKKTPDPYAKAIEWTTRKETFQKRAGFALMAVLAWHNKNNDFPDEKFKQFFPIIIREATDERNFVKKAVNWALRQIGKSRPSLRQPAIDTAKEILNVHSKRSRGAKWIANDALRELEAERR